jgi:16S rRNA (guanine966-N2)-methyltransferase
VEKNPLHVRFIREVVDKLKIENARIISDDAFRFIRFTKYKFDIVFADPPYDFPFIAEIPPAVTESGILNQEGILILEHSKDQNFIAAPYYIETRQYGKVNFSFFKI